MHPSGTTSEAGGLLLTRLLDVGFDEASLRSLAADEPLLRRLYARVHAGRDPQIVLDAVADPLDAACPTFVGDLVPLGLQPTEWLDFLDERNRFAPMRHCVFVPGQEYVSHAVFEADDAPPPKRLVLIETSNGTRTIPAMQDAAEILVPGSVASTRPRLVFEVLRALWERFNDINAAYVMVASARREPNAPFPIIFNPPQGSLRVGFVQEVPRNSGYTGYLAYAA